MKRLFPGFNERTEEELLALWQNAIFVFDTNMLLNVYRYQEATVDRFFEILSRLNEKIWIPHQVIFEYYNNRLGVIDDQLKVYSDVSKALKDAQDLLVNLKYLRERHRFIEIDAIIAKPLKSLGEANNELSASKQLHGQDYRNLKTHDHYREKLEQLLLQDKIGEPYQRDQLINLYHQADKRFELQIPPGWKDKRKTTYDKYGDAIIWFQLLDYARNEKKPIIFVTDDGKSDWFLPIQNRKYQPRPELIQEMLAEADVLLHIHQGYEFFDWATRSLNLKPEPSISEDAKEVSEQNALESQNQENEFIEIPGTGYDYGTFIVSCRYCGEDITFSLLQIKEDPEEKKPNLTFKRVSVTCENCDKKNSFFLAELLQERRKLMR